MSRSNEKLIFYTLIGGPALLAWGLKALRQSRLIEDTPSSKARSAAMGLVEMSGTAYAAAPVTSPVSSVPCCWWRCVVTEKSGKHTKTLKDTSSGGVFYLEDETGRVLVDPLGAESHLETHVHTLAGSQTQLIAALKSWGITPDGMIFGHRNITVTEHMIAIGRPLYVMGELQSLGQDLAAYADDRKMRFAERLRAVKRDPKAMAEADLNKDGTIDTDEWDTFRQKLEEAVKTEPLNTGARPRGIVRSPQDHPFILASSEKHVQKNLVWAWPAVIGGIMLEGLGVWIMVEEGHNPGIIAMVSGLGLAAGIAIGLIGSRRIKK